LILYPFQSKSRSASSRAGEGLHGEVLLRASCSSGAFWIREMSEEEIQQVGKTAPTIDIIEVAEFESHADLKE